MTDPVDGCPPGINQTPDEPVQVAPADPDYGPPQPEDAVGCLDQLQLELDRAGGLHPQLIDGLFMRVLAAHFSDPRYIFSPLLKDAIWSDDPTQRGIWIYPLTNGPDGDPPLSIIIKDGDTRVSRLGLGDYAGTDVDGQHYLRKVDGSHTFFATGGSGPEIRALAWEVFETFNVLTPDMHRFFNSFEVQAISGAGFISELGDALAKTVQVTYSFDYHFVRRPALPDIRQALVSFDTNLQ